MSGVVELFPSPWVTKQNPWPQVGPERYHVDWFPCRINNGQITSLAHLSKSDYFNIYISMVVSQEKWAQWRDVCAGIFNGETRINLNDFYYSNGITANRHIHTRTRPYSQSGKFAAGYEISTYKDGKWILLKEISPLFSESRNKFWSWAIEFANRHGIKIENNWRVVLRPSDNIPVDIQNEIFNMFSDESLPLYSEPSIIADLLPAFVEEEKKNSFLGSVFWALRRWLTFIFPIIKNNE